MKIPHKEVVLVIIAFLGFVIGMASSALPYDPPIKIPVIRMVHYQITVLTNHKDTNGLMFQQSIRVLPSIGHRAVLHSLKDDFVLIPTKDGTLYLPQHAIQGFKIIEINKREHSAAPTYNNTELTDYSKEIPSGPTIRLDKL